MAGKVISLVNFKGGVGKTTLTVNLASCLAKEHDKKVLTLDLDPQSNSSIWLMGPAKWSLLNSGGDLIGTSAAMFSGKVIEDTFINPFTDPTGNFLPQFCLCPANLGMLDLQAKIWLFCNKRKLEGTYNAGDEYFLFAKAARLLRERFDFVLVDCPPNLDLGTCNALCHSDHIVIPCIPDTLSTSGLKLMIEKMEKLVAPLLSSQRLKIAPSIIGVAITKFKGATNEHQSGLETIENIIEEFRSPQYRLVDEKTVVFRDQPMGEYIVHSEAVQESLPLCFYAPASKAYGQVKALTQAVLSAVEDKK